MKKLTIYLFVDEFGAQIEEYDNIGKDYDYNVEEGILYIHALNDDQKYGVRITAHKKWNSYCVEELPEDSEV